MKALRQLGRTRQVTLTIYPGENQRQPRTLGKRLTLLVLGFLLIFLLTACKTKETPQPELDTAKTFQILKTKAMQTAQAQLTLASILEPTQTPYVQLPASSEGTATTTPTVDEPKLPEITPRTPLPPAATYTPWPGSAAYHCRAELITPRPAELLYPDMTFETHWRLTNNGSQPWDHPSVDVVFMDGDRLHTTGDVIDLPETINPGGTLDLFINMRTPSQPGSLQTAWALKRGTLYFCSLNRSLEVIEP
jgi:hypothetical protein